MARRDGRRSPDPLRRRHFKWASDLAERLALEARVKPCNRWPSRLRWSAPKIVHGRPLTDVPFGRLQANSAPPG